MFNFFLKGKRSSIRSVKYTTGKNSTTKVSSKKTTLRSLPPVTEEDEASSTNRKCSIENVKLEQKKMLGTPRTAAGPTTIKASNERITSSSKGQPLKSNEDQEAIKQPCPTDTVARKKKYFTNKSSSNGSLDSATKENDQKLCTAGANVKEDGKKKQIEPKMFAKTEKERLIDAGMIRQFDEYPTMDDVLSDWESEELVQVEKKKDEKAEEKKIATGVSSAKAATSSTQSTTPESTIATPSSSAPSISSTTLPTSSNTKDLAEKLKIETLKNEIEKIRQQRRDMRAKNKTDEVKRKELVDKLNKKRKR